ncbi:hypothetical protein RDI58_013428 [Solanum bulbocastanum]|uniref:Uncharacterized protein n=1 Tax=Solanum bulbocastanum TaxID=147425 RepID=A0AAN8YHQ5_SOLBU
MTPSRWWYISVQAICEAVEFLEFPEFSALYNIVAAEFLEFPEFPALYNIAAVEFLESPEFPALYNIAAVEFPKFPEFSKFSVLYNSRLQSKISRISKTSSTVYTVN